MEKLLTLSQETLLSGRSRSKWMPKGGIWDSATGLNPYIESDAYRGLCAVTAYPTDMTGSDIVDIPMAHVTDQRGSTNNLYILGSSGNFYTITVNNAVTNIRSGADVINSPANGMLIMQPAGGSPVLYYARSSRIGSWNLSGTYPTGWNDNAFSTNIATTAHRPMHKLDRIGYYGNKNYVGYIYDAAGTLTSVPQALTLDELEVCTALSDDGRYVIVGASQPTLDSYGSNTSCRVLWWNGGADEVIWQVRIPNESSIRTIINKGGQTYVIGSRAAYVVQLGVQDAQTIYRFDSDEAIPYDGTNYGHPEAVCPFYDGIMFGALGTALTKPDPTADTIIYNPLHGMTGSASLYVTDFLSNKIYVGTRSSKLYRFDMASAGYTSNTFDTKNIDLGGEYNLSRLHITLPNGIGASDSLAITVVGRDGDATETITITQTKYGDKNHLRIPLSKNIKTTHLKLSFAPSAGIPSWSTIELYGVPATA